MKRSIYSIIAAVVLITLLALGGWWLIKKASPSVSLERATRIDRTPEEITRIRQISQWEFLSVSTEEMVDTTQKSFWGDKVLCRIYTGTLRLGINMDKAPEDWCSVTDSVVTLKLPAVGLLDVRFIDEARTRSFYEKGNWDSNVQDVLYRKAEEQMKRRALTPENLAAAETNGRQVFTRLFQSFGYKKIEITFEK